MDEQPRQDKIVNANDNHRASWLRKIDIISTEKYAPFIPLASWLIEKHCKKWWKNHPEVWDYQYCQMGICGTLQYPRHTKEWTADFVSISLGCNPLELINDQETMDRIPELTHERKLRAAEAWALEHKK